MSMIVSIISPPGGGKTTILNRISEQFGVPVVSSGDIARQMQQELGADFLHKGDMAPEQEMRIRLQQIVDELLQKHPVVLADGFPRFIDQYLWMRRTFPDTAICLYHLDVPSNVIWERLRKRGRFDDNMETFKRRLSNYMELTYPMVVEFNVPKYSYDFVVQSILAEKSKWEEMEHGDVLLGRSNRHNHPRKIERVAQTGHADIEFVRNPHL